MTRTSRALVGAALLGATSVAAAAPTAVAVQPRGDLICLWDVPNQVGGICIPGLDPIIRLIEELLSRLTAPSFAL